MFHIHFDEVGFNDFKPIPELPDSSTCFIDLPFKGGISGHFILGIRKEDWRTFFEEQKDQRLPEEDVTDSFLKEYLTVAAGETLSAIQQEYPDIKLDRPQVIQGAYQLPDYYKYRITLAQHTYGSVEGILALNIDEHKESQEDCCGNPLPQSSKSEFIKNMNYMLRSKLHVILGLSDYLLFNSGKLDETYRTRALEMIQESTNYLLDLVKDVSDPCTAHKKLDLHQEADKVSNKKIVEQLEELMEKYRSKKILFCGYDNFGSEYIQIILKDKFDVLVAEKNYETLSVVEKSRPDVIFFNFNSTKDQSQLEIVNTIRGANRDMPLFALIDPDMEVQLTKDSDSGFTDYLVKPFKELDLLRLIYQYL